MRCSLLFIALAVSCGSARPPDKHQASAPPPPSVSPNASAGAVGRDLPEVARDPREPLLANAASALLGHEHVLARSIDDAVSKEAFERFITELDGGKLFLLE